MITLTEKDNGSHINVAKDEKVEIALTWKASSGYFWQISDISAGELIQVKHDGSDGTPGSASIVRFLFRIVRKGLLTLNYARPWSETDPQKWFTVVVDIEELPH